MRLASYLSNVVKAGQRPPTNSQVIFEKLFIDTWFLFRDFRDLSEISRGGGRVGILNLGLEMR